ncbi:hypothetical protein KY335_02915 [Candidatus Woesearchaeota archaeon]|nr:hypothetical protein [Candidatus Woesearchaeota archaeon]
MKKRYSHIDFKPPKSVSAAAKRGLELRKKFKRGGLSSITAGKLGIGSGIVRATNLARRSKMSPSTVKRMKNYFTRHQRDKRPGWSNPKNPSNGYIAWLLWGGDPGFAWAKKIVKQMKAADEKYKKNKKSR